MADDNSILEKTDRESVLGVALLSFQSEYLSNKWSPDTIVDVMTMNDTYPLSFIKRLFTVKCIYPTYLLYNVLHGNSISRIDLSTLCWHHFEHNRHVRT